MDTHRHCLTVRFGECDPAGVVYYPRFFDWFHRAMEGWFGEGLGQPYHQVLREYGFPAAHAEADYLLPCRMGEELVVELAVTELGRASVGLGFKVRGPDEVVRAIGRVVVVVVTMAPGRDEHFGLQPLPDTLRTAMSAFLQPDFLQGEGRRRKRRA